jgi:hypothetical protein
MGKTSEIKKINLRQFSSEKLTMSPDEIPTTAPEEALNQFVGDDKEPFYKIQEIEYPIKANGYVYVESFFESFIEKIKTNLIPGSKDGHEMRYGKRGQTDFLLVGGLIKSNGDKTGKVYLKNYIPPFAESDNSNFIREAKANMIDFSLVSYTRDVREGLPDGSSVWNVVESMFGERNDAVGYGEGSMEQKTNSLNGEVDNKGELKVNELLDKLKALKVNGEITLHGIAKHLGLENQLITEDQKANLSKFNAVQGLCGDTDPETFVTGLIADKKANAAEVKEAKLNKLAGLEKLENGDESPLRAHANTYFENREMTDENIEAFKKNSVTVTLAGQGLDPYHKANDLGKVDDKDKKKNAAGDGEVKVVKI